MPDDLEARVDALLDGAEAPTSEPEPGPEAQPESTQEPELKFADLDAVIPDDPAIPEGYRKKPIADVVRVAEQHKYEAGLAATRNQEWNRMQAERDAARLALQFFQQERAAQQQAPQQPSETVDDYLQRLALDPQAVIGDAVRQGVKPIEEELRQTRGELFRTRSDHAQLTARDGLGIPPEVWVEISGPVGVEMAVNQWPTDNPQAWAEAARRYLDRSLRLSQRFAPQPAARPAVEVPRPGAPPNGTARSQSRPAAPSRLKPAVKGLLDDIADAAGLDPKRKANLEKFAADNIGGGL